MDAKEIKYLRETIGLSQGDFANMLDTSVWSVSRWEQEVGNPSKQSLNRLKILSVILESASKKEIDEFKAKLEKAIVMKSQLGVLKTLLEYARE